MNGDRRIRRFLMVIAFVLIACAQNAPTDSELEHVFTTNMHRFEEVGRVCSERPEVKSLEIKGGELRVTAEPGYTPELDLKHNRLATTFLKETGVLKIMCLRNYSVGKGELVLVRYVLYAVGLSVSGRMKAIDQIVMPDSAWVDQGIQTGELRSLPRVGWYIYEPDSQ